MSDEGTTEDRHPLKRRGSIHETVELFRSARFVAVPLPFLMPEYIKQVGSDGLRFIVMLIVAYDQGRFRHRGGLTDGWLAIPDRDLATWWGFNTTAPVRKARAKVLAADPQFLSAYREGASGLPSEYQIRRLTAEDRIRDVPFRCAGMRTRRPRTSDDDSEMAEIALEYATEGAFSVIPVKRDKTAYVKWKAFQTRRPTDQEIRRWFQRWPNANIGVVTGAISDLVVVDIDGDRERGFELLRRHGVEVPRTRMVETGRGGVHLWFAHPGVHTPTLAAVLTDGNVQIDVRGDGGYALVPPSVHENGKQYRRIDDVKGALPVLPGALTSLLDKRQHTMVAEANDGNRALNTQVEEILARVDIVRIIESHGVSLEREMPDRYRGLCPFHPDTTASFVVTPSKGLFHCFGCEAAGNAIQFVQRYTRVKFVDALRSLR